MANEQNLIPQAHVLTVEEASKGGKASGEARRERKALKEAILAVLSEPVRDKAGNPHPSGMNMQEAMIRGVIKRAISGDPRALVVIRDTIGEKPVDVVEVVKPKTELADEIEAMMRGRS